MMKLISTKGKYYICDGTYCNKCKLRFQCFSDRGKLVIDWQELHSKYKGSPSMVLRELIGGKVFVEGSRKYKEILFLL